MNEAERHYEYSELTEETLNRRAVHKTKTVEDIILTVFENEMLSKAICELTEIQRKRLLLYYYDHLTYEQVAKIEGCTKMPVMRSIKKAEEKIKKFFISGKIPAFFLGYRANGEKETFALQLEK